MQIYMRVVAHNCRTPRSVLLDAGLGDIMLTCYGSLSRNRSVGVRLGLGEKLGDILASSSQVAEGVATAGEHRSCATNDYIVSLGSQLTSFVLNLGGLLAC